MQTIAPRQPAKPTGRRYTSVVQMLHGEAEISLVREYLELLEEYNNKRTRKARKQEIVARSEALRQEWVQMGNYGPALWAIGTKEASYFRPL